jgi:uncharacterized membrane protein
MDPIDLNLKIEISSEIKYLTIIYLIILILFSLLFFGMKIKTRQIQLN